MANSVTVSAGIVARYFNIADPEGVRLPVRFGRGQHSRQQGEHERRAQHQRGQLLSGFFLQ
jgi:hypothetical protein